VIPIFEEEHKATCKEIAELEDERVVLILDLMATGMSEKDAVIAVDLHMQITAPNPKMP
jgi:orotate phosphoribosyltransferase